MRIAIIPGDGIGVETTTEAVKAIRAVGEVFGRSFDLEMLPWGADYYLQTIQVVFKEHQLPRGVWVSRGRKIDPSAIETALMTVEGELDDISGVGQTKAAHALTPNIPGARHVHWEQPRVGHYGIFNGRKWREQIMPRVRDFIRANDA